MAQLFSWDMTSLTPALGTAPPVSQLAGQFGSGGATLANNPNDGNTPWMNTGVTGFSTIYWYNNTNTDVWGTTLGKGLMEFDWMYTGTYPASALLIQITGKSQSGPLDGNEGVALYSKLIGGSNDPGIGPAVTSGGQAQWVSPLPDTKYHITYRWNRMSTNVNGVRTQVVYLFQNSGTIRTSAWASATIAAPVQPVWHHMLPGNDTAISFNQWLDNLSVENDWAYDLPITLWQDFEFATVSQANLEAQDHVTGYTWTLLGNTARFSTSASGQQTSPSTINLWTDAGTLGLRNDLTVTALGSVGFTFASQSAARTVGFWLKTAALASGTSARILYGDNSAPTIVVAVDQTNMAGQQTLVLRNNAGTASGSVVNVVADKWYYCTLLAIRNSTCRLRVYDHNGVPVGSEITVTGTNSNLTGFRIGSNAAYTAQAAGVYHYVDNLVFDVLSYFPLRPWDADVVISGVASGPSSGLNGVPSTNFTYSINGDFDGIETVTISDNGGGGIFTPSVGAPGVGSAVVTPANGATSFTFTYTPASVGPHVISFTNGQGWTNPANLDYLATESPIPPSDDGGCIFSLPLNQQLDAIYCALVSGGVPAGLPECECVAGLILQDKLSAIYCYFKSLSDEPTLKSCECVAGLPLQYRVDEIYCAILAESTSDTSCQCVRGLPLNLKAAAIYCLLWTDAGSPNTLPDCDCIRGLPLSYIVGNIYRVLTTG